jgi:hypothetical protein
MTDRLVPPLRLVVYLEASDVASFLLLQLVASYLLLVEPAVAWLNTVNS